LDMGESHNGDIKRAAHGYEPTREAAMAAFAKSWRREMRNGSGVRETPSFQSTPLVEGISVRGSTIERGRPRPVPRKSRAEGKCETRRNWA